MKIFEEFGVFLEICKVIEEMGYENFMLVQEEVILYLLGENNDVVVFVQIGMGKIVVFGLFFIQKINVKNRIF